MGAKGVIFALFLAVTVVSWSHQVSAARRLVEDSELGTKTGHKSKGLQDANHEHIGGSMLEDSYQSNEYQNLEEIDRLKLSINKLICGTMEEGCDHMDDAADHSDTTDNMTESFATLHPEDHVRDY